MRSGKRYLKIIPRVMRRCQGGSAQRVGFFNIGSGRVLEKIPGSGSGSVRVGVLKYPSGIFGYLFYSRVFRGIPWYLRVFLGISVYFWVYWISSFFKEVSQT